MGERRELHAAAIAAGSAVHAPGAAAALPTEIRRSRRRTLSIEVRRGPRVIVRAPAHCPATAIDAYLAERRAWIERHAERFRSLEAARPPPPAWTAGATHLYMGEPLRLAVEGGPRVTVGRSDDLLRVTVPGGAARDGAEARVRRAVEAWYRERARADFTAAIAAHVAYFATRGHALPALGIRRMTSRWGSLAGGGRRRVPGLFDRGARAPRMTLNLALVHAPRECLEYVVVHELCHLEHHGHGPAFYRLLERLLPDWRARKHRLEDLQLLDADG